MARIRSIKPEAFSSETLAGCSVHARWTFAGLWCYVDDEGRGRSNAGLVKAAVWPLDDDITPPEVSQFLDELEAARLICRYDVDGKSYLHVVNFPEHQHPNRPLASKLPACSRRTHGGLTESAVSMHSRGFQPLPAPAAAAPEVNGTEQVAKPAIAAGQAPLIEHAVSSHGARRAKSSSTPPTPLRNELGEVEGDGNGDGVQQAAPAAASESRPAPTPTQRSKPITDAYAKAQPMCKWPAINGVVVHAIKSGKYSDDEICAALLRMAETGQTVTVESLRVEIEGFAPRQNVVAGTVVDRREQARHEQRQRQMTRAMQREGDR